MKAGQMWSVEMLWGQAGLRSVPGGTRAKGMGTPEKPRSVEGERNVFSGKGPNPPCGEAGRQKPENKVKGRAQGQAKETSKEGGGAGGTPGVRGGWRLVGKFAREQGKTAHEKPGKARKIRNRTQMGGRKGRKGPLSQPKTKLQN